MVQGENTTFIGDRDIVQDQPSSPSKRLERRLLKILETDTMLTPEVTTEAIGPVALQPVAPSDAEEDNKSAGSPAIRNQDPSIGEDDPYAERMEFLGVMSLGIAAAVAMLFWIVPFLNILLCLAGMICGIIAISGGETWNGSLGVVANFLLLIWSVIWTFIVLSPLLLI